MRAKEIARVLRDIATLLGLGKESRFKIEAYERGAQVVEALGDELSALVESGRLTDVEGIGPSLAKQIVELTQTGASSLLARLEREYPPGAAELARVPGLTLRRLRILHENLGITSPVELREACEGGRVRGLSGFGEKLEQKLLEALNERERGEQAEPRMLLADALVLAGKLEEKVAKIPGVTRLELAGSARRGHEVLDRLELLVVRGGADDREPERSLPLDTVLETTTQALLRDGVPVEVHLAEAGAAGTELLFATGPKEHLGALMEVATARDLTLRERGLFRGDERLAESADERDVYAALGLPFIPPERRGASLAHPELDELVSLSDVIGMVHCHTTYSDGRGSIEEMARAAEQLGMEYLTITDHSPSAHYAGGVTLDRLKQQWDEIAEVQERVKVRLLRGTESDILGDGSLDYPDDVLERFDVIIASIHSRHRMNRADMTERLVRAMQQPVYKIWGHALGRMLLRRDPIDCDVERVLDALVSSRGAIEINGDPHRLDLPPEWLPHAKARGIPFVLSADAHSPAGMGALHFAVTMARRGGLTRGEVLNTLPYERFRDIVKPVAS